jgi:hypothetical protein
MMAKNYLGLADENKMFSQVAIKHASLLFVLLCLRGFFNVAS